METHYDARTVRGRRRESGPPIEGDDTLMVITGGGRKRSEGETIARDRFNEMVSDAFGLSSPTRLRDGFNLVELNTVLFECRAQRNHVPPWLHVTVRAPGDLRPLPHGEEGLLGYLDPSAQSYPCFIVTDDVGVLRTGPCECGHSGRTLDVLRRVRRLAHQGCGLELESRVGDRHGD
ncbi:hypothetical protein [Actinomadura sp. 7K507]|uniref:LuxE/PaaK family acyltransferase n=1 Tax=Actinomadura sp. 7K507 TaxID=2530365 RepID=UPI001051BB8E|nr:hypothetical protein [Actinomadura sp. 7K507]TDC86425.1 hypothetical protein E1285_23270 [Actinomadura sp. 7K507]